MLMEIGKDISTKEAIKVTENVLVESEEKEKILEILKKREKNHGKTRTE